ncbi:hypothetical protein BDV96DRAFT_506119 [Lophiotrema nucula]|uniref:Rhodopsin domain-containing protein n=1 Tax=Lophiotrema nucula TaxID=690887 RepID=A0A6A5YJI1_9PLEO|nr:hypothetical protein BDV96DRAFT_506119 [Lophiotrema nucula]
MSFSPTFLAEDNSASLLDTCIFFIVIESFFITLMYTSRYLSSDNKANTWMTLLLTSAYCTCLSKITTAILMVKIGGAGHHMPALEPSTIQTLFKLLTAHQIICPLTTSLTKLGILVLFNQILSRTSQLYKRAIQVTFVLVLLTAIVQVLIPFGNCKPFAFNWNKTIEGGSCAFNDLALWRYLTIPNVITTIMMVVIPLPAMYRLQVSTATKAALYLVFSVAIVGFVAAIMRFHAFLAVKNFNDFSFEIIEPECWTIAESGIYLVVGVLPTLRPLVRQVCRDGKFDRLLSRSFGRSRKSASADTTKRDSATSASMVEQKEMSSMPMKTGIEARELEYSGSPV